MQIWSGLRTLRARTPLLALRYQRLNSTTTTPCSADGRGFLYGQLRDRHGHLQDLVVS